MTADIHITPEQIYDLILDLEMPLPTTSALDNEFRKWEDDVQSYYDRLAELRRKLNEAIPEDAPLWVQGATYRAWRGEVSEAERWRASVKRRRRRAGTRSMPA